MRRITASMRRASGPDAVSAGAVPGARAGADAGADAVGSVNAARLARGIPRRGTRPDLAGSVRGHLPAPAARPAGRSASRRWTREDRRRPPSRPRSSAASMCGRSRSAGTSKRTVRMTPMAMPGSSASRCNTRRSTATSGSLCPVLLTPQIAVDETVRPDERLPFAELRLGHPLASARRPAVPRPQATPLVVAHAGGCPGLFVQRGAGGQDAGARSPRVGFADPARLVSLSGRDSRSRGGRRRARRRRGGPGSVRRRCEPARVHHLPSRPTSSKPGSASSG